MAAAAPVSPGDDLATGTRFNMITSVFVALLLSHGQCDDTNLPTQLPSASPSMLPTSVPTTQPTFLPTTALTLPSPTPTTTTRPILMTTVHPSLSPTSPTPTQTVMPTRRLRPAPTRLNNTNMTAEKAGEGGFDDDDQNKLVILGFGARELGHHVIRLNTSSSPRCLLPSLLLS